MMQTTCLLTQRDVARVTTPARMIDVIRRAFMATERGDAHMPPKVYLPLPHGADFRAMPAALTRPPACGIKWVNVHPQNRARGLPTVMALIILNDVRTGFPLAVMDGQLITKLRTAASAAVAADALARPESRVVGLVGCGAQADAQLIALAEVRRIRAVRVWGWLHGEAARFCASMRRRLPRVVFTPEARIQDTVQRADIVVTVTPARRPLIRRGWIAPGTHLNAIGADGPGKQELDPAILRDALVVVDDRTQAVHGGELNVPVSQGRYNPRKIHAELGAVLVKSRPGRRRASEITVFDSTGIAIHDVAAGYEVYRRATRAGLGRFIRFFE